MGRDLRENVLPFWVREVVDREHGGFHGYVSDQGIVDPLAPKGGVLCSRILWTYSAALRRTGDEAHRRMADRAFAYLRDRFWDAEHGGTYWMLDYAGRPVADRKQTYALAFSLYALAEHHRATGSGDALERAVGLYRSIEAHASDPGHGGYGEARAEVTGGLVPRVARVPLPGAGGERRVHQIRRATLKHHPSSVRTDSG